MSGIINGVNKFLTDRAYELKATKDVLSADKDRNGKLNVEEYKALSAFNTDSFLDSHARGFEFAVIDELDQADGQIGIRELARFYKKADANNDGDITPAEYNTVMHKSAVATKVRFPLAAAATSLSHWGHQFSEWVSKPRD